MYHRKRRLTLTSGNGLRATTPRGRGSSHWDVGAVFLMGESYFLAVDVGTSRVGAATARLSADGSISAASFPLGRRSDSVATVVFVAEDGELLFGDVAERRGVTQPERLIREFKRSIGD